MIDPRAPKPGPSRGVRPRRRQRPRPSSPWRRACASSSRATPRPRRGGTSDLECWGFAPAKVCVANSEQNGTGSGLAPLLSTVPSPDLLSEFDQEWTVVRRSTAPPVQGDARPAGPRRGCARPALGRPPTQYSAFTRSALGARSGVDRLSTAHGLSGPGRRTACGATSRTSAACAGACAWTRGTCCQAPQPTPFSGY